MSALNLTRPEPSEAVVLSAVRKALTLHRAVAWVERLNSGAGKLQYRDGEQSQFLRFGWRGAPDLIGQLRDGRMLAVEVKRPSGRVRPEQAQFLETVREHGGCGFVARGVDDVWRELSG